MWVPLGCGSAVRLSEGRMSNICQTNAAERPISAITTKPPKTPNHLYSRAFRGIAPYHPNTPNLTHNPKVAGSNPAPATEIPGIRTFSRPLAGRVRASSETSNRRQWFFGFGKSLQLPLLCLSTDLRVLGEGLVVHPLRR